MFELVNDIERYPEFLPWCKHAEVFIDNEDGRYDPGTGGDVRAALTISRSRIVERFETLNQSQFPEHIEMQLVQGPFRHLKGLWQFTTLGNLGCKTELTLEYEMSRALLDRAVAGLVKKTVNSVVDAFSARANALYG